MRKLLPIFILLTFCIPSLHAVTKDEMEEARAITALWYLRWANNGSDYLDKLHPKTVAELEGKLKQKEKENIKAFKDVSVPTDYASWNKDKLVEYWGITFFKSSGLNEQGKGARLKVKKLVGQMNIADPTPEPEAEKPAEAAPELPAAGVAEESAEPTLPTAEEIVSEETALDSAAAAETQPEPVEEKKSGSTSTWIYIVALILLIGVVVWLVIFASRTMQSSGKDGDNPNGDSSKSDGREEIPVKRTPKKQREVVPDTSYETPVYSGSEKSESSLREKFARTLASKDEEIRVLHREIHDLREECMKMGEDNGRLKSDLTLAQREVEALRGRLQAATAVASAASSVPNAGYAPAHTEIAPPAEEPVKRSKEAGPERTIYLGRVNQKGIFVRADRKPVDGKTVYILTTTDGYTGSYRVLQYQPTIDMALDNPEYYLAGGCVAPDITDTDNAEGIRTVNAGTAVFEDGCWRLLRKAKIGYE